MLNRLLLSLILCASLASWGAGASAKDSVVGEKTLPSGNPAPKLAKSKKQPQAKTEPVAAPPIEPQVPATPPPPAEEKKPKTVGYDKGFFIQTPDEKWKLVISGYAQFQFNFEREGGENEFGFRMRRVRLAFAGNLGTKKLTYKLQVDFVKFKSELLLDAFIDYKILNDSLRVTAGQFTVPWIRQNIISSSNQQFVERSIATTEFTNIIEEDSDSDGIPDKFVRNGRDIGIMLHGKHFNNKAEYQAGMFNGSGTNTTNLNDSFLWAGRAVYNIKGQAGYEEGDFDYTEHPAIYFGASGNYNSRDVTDDKVAQFGTETGLKYKGFSAQGEFFFRRKMPGDTALARENDFGYYAQAGYFAVPKRLEVAVRASQIFFDGFFNDQAEFGIGVNGYLYKKNLKLQTDYSVLPFDTETGVETAQKFRLQLQSKF